jgi:hypothetical protein
MAFLPKEPLLNASVTIDGTDFSDLANQVAFEDTAAEHDVTTFGSDGYTEERPGLKTATATVTFFQDYSSGGLYQTLFPIYRDREEVVVEILPDADETFGWTFNAALYSLNKFNASVGEPPTTEVVLRKGTGPIVENS